MKVAISSTGQDLAGNVSEVFARCPYFIVAEIEDHKIKKTEVVKNEGEHQIGMAGVSTAQLMAEKNIEAVITGNVGPRALDVLNQFNIAIYLSKGSVQDALQSFIDGKLEKTN